MACDRLFTTSLFLNSKARAQKEHLKIASVERESVGARRKEENIFLVSHPHPFALRFVTRVELSSDLVNRSNDRRKIRYK